MTKKMQYTDYSYIRNSLYLYKISWRKVKYRDGHRERKINLVKISGNYCWGLGGAAPLKLKKKKTRNSGKNRRWPIPANIWLSIGHLMYTVNLLHSLHYDFHLKSASLS